jgi:hypothetical protein
MEGGPGTGPPTRVDLADRGERGDRGEREDREEGGARGEPVVGAGSGQGALAAGLQNHEPTGSIFFVIGGREVCLSTMTDEDREEYKEEVRKNNVEFNAMFGATPEDACPDGDVSVEDILKTVKSWARPADSSWDLSAAQRVPAPPGYCDPR